MRKVFFLAAALCLFSMAAFAQKSNFAGTWTLDKAKSTMDERMRARIESITMTVAQTDAELKVSTATRQAPPPADAPARPAGAGGGRGESVMTYDLSGKETRIETDGPNGKVPQTMKAAAAGGKLSLSSSRTFSTPNGDMTQTTKESWELSPDGKTLTVNREQSSPRGSNTSTLVFTKS